MTRSLAVEWDGRGIRLNAIAPGALPDRGRLSAPGAQRGDGPGADGSAYINGEAVVVEGGEWLKGAGQISLMDALSEEGWEAMKGR
jgi:NAD(P)-dependent dehydrogenase (short-subunit alcohol dehydrogenase family)